LDTLTGQIRLDFRSQEPIYLQIVRQVEKLVQDGALKPGDQLPTVRQMAIDLRINFSTVARAYSILDERRLISTQRGRGTYIWQDSDRDGQAIEKNQVYAEEKDRERHARQLARNFIDELVQQGFTLEEIRQVFALESTGFERTGG
jgi:GntR family transcriptional regulator